MPSKKYRKILAKEINQLITMRLVQRVDNVAGALTDRAGGYQYVSSRISALEFYIANWGFPAAAITARWRQSCPLPLANWKWKVPAFNIHDRS